METYVGAFPTEVGIKAIPYDHCANRTFFEGQAQLNTQWLTMLDLDWANRSANYFQCAQCGKLHWFVFQS